MLAHLEQLVLLQSLSGHIQGEVIRVNLPNKFPLITVEVLF